LGLRVRAPVRVLKTCSDLAWFTTANEGRAAVVTAGRVRPVGAAAEVAVPAVAVPAAAVTAMIAAAVATTRCLTSFSFT